MTNGQEIHTAPKTGALSPERLERLLEISTKLSSTLHLDDLLALVMDVAVELTDTVAASILLLDESLDKLHFVASTGSVLPDDIMVPLDNSIAGWVVRNGRSLIVDDVKSDSRFYASIDKDTQFFTQSILAAPLRTSDKVIGTLEVLNKMNGNAFTSQDVALMEALASQAAVAIVNARLFEQSDLLAEIMHELKTPMMAIQSAAELLSRPTLSAEKRNAVVDMIKQESNRLSKMTKDFLDLARLESHRVRLARESLDVADIVTDVMTVARAQASERQITIETDLDEQLPRPGSDWIVLGDCDRLKQVLLNLVSNAIKYNRDNGRITISAHSDNDTLSLTVVDTGPGIEPEDLEHLFDRFYRIPKSERSAEGSGLGLAIANKIVQQHNGRIDVESTLGEGTTFTVTLPLVAAG